jgi:hypothetical protein
MSRVLRRAGPRGQALVLSPPPIGSVLRPSRLSPISPAQPPATADRHLRAGWDWLVAAHLFGERSEAPHGAQAT